jgi:hypothetical protein
MGRHLDFAVDQLGQPIDDIPRLDLGAGFVVVPDLPDASGHVFILESQKPSSVVGRAPRVTEQVTK